MLDYTPDNKFPLAEAFMDLWYYQELDKVFLTPKDKALCTHIMIFIADTLETRASKRIYS